MPLEGFLEESSKRLERTSTEKERERGIEDDELGNGSSRRKMAFLIRHLSNRVGDSKEEIEIDSNDPMDGVT